MNPLPSSIKAFWKKYEISPTDRIVIGVSGGVDSMVLLHLVGQIHPSECIFVCHIDHNIRTESILDRTLVEGVAKKMGVHFEIFSLDVKKIAEEQKISVESAGRMLRYRTFEKLRELEHARFILTAHHQNDQAETILLNLIRGSRLRGLSGIEERRGDILRPLLHHSKDMIRDYALQEKIEFYEDKSNEDVTFLRNRIRKNIIPEMEIINPTVISSLDKLSLYMQDLDSFIEGFLGVFLAVGTFSEEEFAKLSPILQTSLIEKIYSEANGGTIGLSSGLIDEIIRYIRDAKGGTIKEIGKLRLTKKGRVIRFKE